ncbi:MAG: acetyltransferase [Bacteroidota bacterium]
MKNLLIYGCGYPSMPSLIKYWNTKKDQQWDVAGYIDDVKFGKVDEYFGCPVVGNEQSIPKFIKKGYYFFNNVASSTDAMEIVAQKLSRYKAMMCTLIFPQPPNFDCDTVSIGEGSCVFPDVFVGTHVSIGKNVLIKQQSNISHGTEIGDLCLIAPGVGIMGDVKVGKKTFIGARALIGNSITIGNNCVIGMGAVVTKDIPDNTTVVGIPARPIHTKRESNTTLKNQSNELFITNS